MSFEREPEMFSNLVVSVSFIIKIFDQSIIIKIFDQSINRTLKKISNGSTVD